jgi:Flp pilus assembly protein TadD
MQGLHESPDSLQLRRLVAETALLLGKAEYAAQHLKIVNAAAPSDEAVVINLSHALLALGRPAEAVEYLQPFGKDGSRGVLLNLSRALQDCHRFDASIEVSQRLLVRDPRDAEAMTNLGTVFRDAGRFEEAETCFRRAIRTTPALQAARDNLAHVLLLRGNLPAGFAAYEGRAFKDPTGLSARLPRWTGEPLSGVRLHVIAEQGFGDMLQFFRFGYLLLERGIEAVLHVHPRLVRLLKRSRAFSDVVAYGRAAAGKRAAWVPLMSLPGLLGTTIDGLSVKTPYLAPDPAQVVRYRQWLGAEEKFRIGIAWAGNPQSEQDDLRGRSIPLSAFQVLADLPGIELISLQRLHGLEQLRTAAFTVRQAEPELDRGADGFIDTAALICALDAVVTCDTSIAHLAGGLGCAVHVALHHAADWRWFTGRNDSPWYPTMRLYRQSVPGHWEPVFSRLAASIQLIRAQEQT